MKTSISVPDEVFEQAERMAKRLGISRSELYAREVGEFVERQTQAMLTGQVDAVLSRNASISSLSPELMPLQTQSLAREDW